MFKATSGDTKTFYFSWMFLLITTINGFQQVFTRRFSLNSASKKHV